MATCKDCICYSGCSGILNDFGMRLNPAREVCDRFEDRARFVELNIAKKIKHTPDIDKMREFHKLGLGKGMSERSIFWTCSNCKVWVSLAHKFCPNCGAKFEAEQALKERESNA